MASMNTMSPGIGDASGASGGTGGGFNWSGLAGIGIGGLLGGIGGGAGTPSNSTTNTNFTQNLNLQDFNKLSQGQSGLEANTYAGNLSGYADLQSLVNGGPGAAEVASNNQFQNQYASTLQGLMNNIANPNQQQNYATAQQYFAPQQTALNQQFTDQSIQQNRLAAQLGRAGNDPTMQNMLMKEQTRQQTALNSQIGAFGQQLPSFQAQQIMGVGNQLSNLRGGLATQAMQNRMNLMSMGQQLNQSERSYRLSTAQKTGSQTAVTGSSAGGGIGGQIAGAIAGVGSMAGPIAAMF